jgi:6-bladed beta-propeller
MMRGTPLSSSSPGSVRGVTVVTALLIACGFDKTPRASPVAASAFDAVFVRAEEIELRTPKVGDVGKVTQVIDLGTRILVLDDAQRSVVVVSRRGDIVRSLATVGSGPGELRGPTSMYTVGDTALIVLDIGNMRITRYDLRTYEAVAAMPLLAMAVTVLPGTSDTTVRVLGPLLQRSSDATLPPTSSATQELNWSGRLVAARGLIPAPKHRFERSFATMAGDLVGGDVAWVAAHSNVVHLVDERGGEKTFAVGGDHYVPFPWPSEMRPGTPEFDTWVRGVLMVDQLIAIDGKRFVVKFEARGPRGGRPTIRYVLASTDGVTRAVVTGDERRIVGTASGRIITAQLDEQRNTWTLGYYSLR